MRSVALICLVAVALSACGGGGGDGREGQLLVATGLEGLDGTIRLDSVTGFCEVDAVGLLVGETDGTQKFTTYWGFVTFDISALPAGADIRSATAHVFVNGFAGDNIFGAGLFGNVVMEHIDIGASLDPADMTSPSLSGELVGGDASPTFLVTEASVGFKIADVTAEVQVDQAAGRPRTTLRLSFQATQVTDGDLAGDFVGFARFDPLSPDNELSRPFLEILFTE
jgi:hypothetical protein